MNTKLVGVVCVALAAMMGVSLAGCWETPTGQLRSRTQSQSDRRDIDHEGASSSGNESQGPAQSTSGNGRGGEHKFEKH